MLDCSVGAALDPGRRQW